MCWVFPLNGMEYPQSYCNQIGTVKYAVYIVLGEIVLSSIMAVAGYSGGGVWNMFYAL